MTDPCADFRMRLERVLMDRLTQDEMRALEWHEHLLSCSACRDLLEAEQALEELLASLPEPRLSAEVTRRLLARLRARREAEETALDGLLSQYDVSPPADLAQRVLAGLDPKRADRLEADAQSAPAADEDRRLDRLLDHDQVEIPSDLVATTLTALHRRRDEARDLDVALASYDVSAPDGLADRVRSSLEPERTAQRRRSFLRVVRASGALAAGLLIALAIWLWEPAPVDDGGAVRDELAQIGGDADVPELELLEELIVLEHLDMLEEVGDDLDLLLQMELGPEDEVLLAYDDEAVEDGSQPR